MRAIQTITLFTLVAALYGCSESEESKTEELMQKRVRQEIDVSAMGMIDFDIDSFVVLSDTSCFARHSFYNDMVSADVRVSNFYYFNPGIEKVIHKEQASKTEMKSEGEWVSTGF